MYLCGSYLNKQVAILTVLFVPIGLLLWFSKHILVSYMGQSLEASQYCQLLLRINLIGLYFETLFESAVCFFTAMEKSYIPMIV